MANCSMNITRPCQSSSFTCAYDSKVMLRVPESLYYTYLVSVVFNVVLSVTAVVGNSLVLTALLKTRSLHSPSKALLRSLALSDLFVGISVQPMFIAYCSSGLLESFNVRCFSWIVYPLLSDYFVAVSFLTIVAISIDRYLALRLRARYRQVVTLRKANITVFSVWLTSSILPIARLVAGKVSVLFSCAIFILFIIVPTFTHFKIQHMLRRHEMQVSSQFYLHREESYLSISKYKKSVCAMRYVFLALLVCYVPVACVALLYVQSNPNFTSVLLPVGNFASTLMFFNSSLNPILYCWQIRQVRAAIYNLVNAISCR